MGRIPTPGEIATRYTVLVDQALADRQQPGRFFGVNASAEHRRVRQQLVDLVTALHRAHPIVAESLATALVDLGREIAPPPAPAEDVRARALRLRRERNTGPTPSTRRRR